MEAFVRMGLARVSMWKSGEKRAINPATLSDNNKGWMLPSGPSTDDVGDALSVGIALPVMAANGANRTLVMWNYAKSTCWEPAPFHFGPMHFKFEEVNEALADPKQKRGYYTSTTAQSESFFGRNSLLFLDGRRHREMRDLLERTKFARSYPLDFDLVRRADLGDARGGFDQVVKAVTPLMFKSLLGMMPPADVVEQIQVHASSKLMIFGSTIQRVMEPAGRAAKVVQARKVMASWGASTPWMKLMLSKADKKNPLFQNDKSLVQDLMDAIGFAGLVGTTDMITNCIRMQREDARHKIMFGTNPEKYLIELMRFDSAVTSITDVMRKDTRYEILGRNITFAEGTPRQMGIATANRDPAFWDDPSAFNPVRTDLKSSLSWNGRVKDVEARDFKKAPRHCPGYCLSLKIGAAMCAKFMGSFETLVHAKIVDGEIKCDNFGEASRGGSSQSRRRRKSDTVVQDSATRGRIKKGAASRRGKEGSSGKRHNGTQKSIAPTEKQRRQRGWIKRRVQM